MMQRPTRSSLLIAFLTVAATAAFQACAGKPTTTPRTPPHVLIIVADDLGWKDVGFQGCKDIPTPHLDRLAARGVVFDDAHVTASVCAPSRTGFTLGRYQQREGCEANGRAGHGLPITDVRTFPKVMQQAGYQTLCVGKWHQGQEEGRHPLDQGYTHFSGFLAGSRSYWPLPKARAARALQRDRVRIDESEVTYLTDWLSDEACRLIRDRDTGRPTMMVLDYNAPHTPMHAREDDLARFAGIADKRRRTYAAMVWRMDQGIGRILDTLDRQGIADDTIVVFFSDNGGATNNASDNGPWRGMKGSKWEGGHRVPFVMCWPDKLEPGHYDQPIVTFDLMPTCLAAAGEPVPSWADGVDLIPYLRGSIDTAPHETLYWRRMAAAALREGRWKLVRVDRAEGKGHDWHLIDLQANPGETKDVAAANPEVLAALKARMAQWESQMRTPLWREGERWERNQRYKHRMDTLGREMERRFP